MFHIYAETGVMMTLLVIKRGGVKKVTPNRYNTSSRPWEKSFDAITN